MKTSCLIAARNVELWIAQTLRSAIGFDEILLADDGSEDSTLAIAQAMQPTIPNLWIFKSNKQRGIIKTKRQLVQRATGDAILFLDSDDYLLEGPERLVEAIAGGAAAVCGPVLHSKTRRPTGPVGPNGPDVWYLLLRCHWPTSSGMFRADRLKEISASAEFQEGPFELQALLEMAIAGDVVKVLPPPAIAFYRNDWSDRQAHHTSRPVWVEIIKRAYEMMPSDRRKDPAYEMAYVNAMTMYGGFTDGAAAG